MSNEHELTNTGVFAVVRPFLPPGELARAEASCSAVMLERDRDEAPQTIQQEVA
jgi:hypothetical protein